MLPKDFVKMVVTQYESGAGVFEKKINAEELIPAGMEDLAKSQFIFYVLQLDYAMKSQILYRGAAKLYATNTQFFTPGFIGTLADTDLSETLKTYLRPRYINEAIRRYRHNTQVLQDKYQGAPREIFMGSLLCHDVLAKLKAFRGFGPKIGNFFVRTMINTFEYDFADIDNIIPPVDVHDVHIAYLLSFTDTPEMTQKNINFVKQLWNSACNDAKVSWLIFDKALWLLGSEGNPKSREDVLELLK